MRKTIMKRCLALMAFLVMAISLPAQTLDNTRITVNMKDVTVKQFLDEVKRQTKIQFLYNADELKSLPRVTVNETNAPTRQVMNKVMRQIGCQSEENNGIVTITPLKRNNGERTVKGIVKDNEGNPLIGVPVCIGESRVCTVTDADGFYTFKIPVERTVLKFSYVGMDNKYEAILQGTADVNRDIVMSSATQLKDVVVTGIFNRKKESFTGSAATYNKDDLIQMGSSNVLQSLKTLDPAFAIIEDNCPVQFFRFANALEGGLGISRCPYISEFCSISVLVVPPIMLKRGLKPFPLIFSHHLRVNDPLRSGRF